MVVTQVAVDSGASMVTFEPRPGMPGPRLLWVEPDGATRVLAAEFDSACDPEVSHDAKRLLFAGRRTRGEVWSLWELEFESGAVRQVLYELRFPPDYSV